ncbi:MAG TPA: DUF2000 domain-containing protein [Patescibacteria group bacterium]
MDLTNKKCVLIINEELPAGIIANIASVLSITLGDKIRGLVGPDVTDRQGSLHPGLTQLPIPVLGAPASDIKSLRESFKTKEGDSNFIADFTTFAGMAKTYEEYSSALESADAQEINYLGIAVLSDKKTLNRLTKGLSLIGD